MKNKNISRTNQKKRDLEIKTARKIKFNQFNN